MSKSTESAIQPFKSSPEDTPSGDVEQWSFTIRPHTGIFDLKLGELWRYRDLIFLFVRRDFVAKFKQTILGPAWFVLQPLLTTLMFTVIFGNIAQMSTDGLPKILFYLSGNVLWIYFADSLTQCSNTFTANANIFGKVYFPRLVVPVSIVISQVLTFALQFTFFLFFMGFYLAQGAEIDPNAHMLLLPVLVVLMAGMGLGFGIVFSSLTTKYRDMRFLLDFGVRLVMYATPVIYPLSSIPDKYVLLILANPVTPIIETFRYGFLGAGSFSWGYLGYSVAFTFAILFAGVMLFTKVERTFMDTV